MSSLLRSSKFLRYFVGAARNLVATKLCPETGQYLSSASNATSYIRSLTSQAYTSTQQYTSNLDKSLHQLDQDARRAGRISRKELEEVLEELKQSKNATSSQSLMVIRCCGSLVPEELPEVRTKLVQEIWSTLERLKVPMDISHYNALLRVYIENEHNFSPAEFLQTLEKKGVEPNRVTYQRLITRYCQQGDIDGATKILEYMREKSLPVNESVFNALIMGHSQADDMESAVGILSVMKQAGLEPSADTYTTLLVGYAKRGDIESIQKAIDECDKQEIQLSDKDYLEVLFALATNGHASEVDDILKRIRKSAGFNQDAICVILRLINHNQEEVALKIFRLMPRVQKEEAENVTSFQGSFLVRQLVKAQRPVDTVISVCRQMEEEGINSKALSIATETALLHGNIDLSLSLLKAMKDSGSPIRQHYFWPLFCSAGRVRNDDKIAHIAREMSHSFGVGIWSETVREFVIPNLTIENSDAIVGFLKRAGITAGSTASSLVLSYLEKGNIAEAANVASKYRAFYSPGLFRRPLNIAFINSRSADHYLSLIHLITEGLDRGNLQGQEENETNFDSREIVGSILLDLLYAARDRNIDLKPILEGLLEKGLGISSEKAEQIQSKLSGERLTNEISDLLSKLTEPELKATQAVRNRIPDSAFVSDSATLLARIAKQEETGQSASVSKRSLVFSYCREKEIDKAIEVLESLGAEAGPGAYAHLVEALTDAGRLDDALNYAKKQLTLFPESPLHSYKVVRLVEQLFKNDRFSEGIALLEQNKLQPNEEVPFSVKSAAFQSLNILAEKGDVETLEKTFDLLVNNNYVEVTNVLLGPLVKVHFVKGDIDKAISKLEEFVEKYKLTPWKGEITKKLIEAENATMLQKVTDIGSKVHGEVNSLYDLVFGFVECGRIRQARRILETPGLRNRQQRLNTVCERYQQEGSVAALEGLIEATKDMNYIERGDIFYNLLRAHIKNDDPDKALGVWTQMQEEDIHASEDFLLKLANFLESKGRDVPFIKPTKKKVAETTPIKQKIDTPTGRGYATPALLHFKNAVRNKDWQKAMELNGELDHAGAKINTTDISLLLEGLCQTNQLDNAFKIALSRLERGEAIVNRHLKFFINKISDAGEVDKINQIGQHLNTEMKRLVSYDNKRCGAYLKCGRVSEYMDELLEQCKSATPETIQSLSDSFPRGAIIGIVENHPEFLPKLEVLADKFMKHGFKNAANALWISLFLNPEYSSRADEIWQKFDLSSEPRLMFQRILGQVRNLNDVELANRLLKRLKGSKVSEPGLGIIHSRTIDALVKRNQVDEALLHLKNSLNDISLEHLNTTTLQRVKKLAEDAGKPFPFTIPNKLIPEKAPDPTPLDVFTYLVNFKSSHLRNSNNAVQLECIKDDHRLLNKYPFDCRSIIEVTPPTSLVKPESSSSSSSDDESEEKVERK